MDQKEAKKLAEGYLENVQAGCEDALEINDDLTIDHSLGYVFTYNKADYWQTKDMDDSLFGNGPILVKKNGELVILPTHQPVRRSLGDLERG